MTLNYAGTLTYADIPALVALVLAELPNGIPGVAGPPGTASVVPGPSGASSYALAQQNGYQGTLAQWLASLVGPTGANGSNGANAGPSGAVTITTPTNNTIYQNTSGKALYVNCYGSCAGSGSIQVNVSPNSNLSSPTTVYNAAGIPSGFNWPISFVVPIGWYYKVTFSNWTLSVANALA